MEAAAVKSTFNTMINVRRFAFAAAPVSLPQTQNS
jgi:hypothetical protein